MSSWSGLLALVQSLGERSDQVAVDLHCRHIQANGPALDHRSINKGRRQRANPGAGVKHTRRAPWGVEHACQQRRNRSRREELPERGALHRGAIGRLRDASRLGTGSQRRRRRMCRHLKTIGHDSPVCIRRRTLRRFSTSSVVCPAGAPRAGHADRARKEWRREPPSLPHGTVRRPRAGLPHNRQPRQAILHSGCRRNDDRRGPWVGPVDGPTHSVCYEVTSPRTGMPPG